MRLKRKMTEAEFANAIQNMRPPPARVLEIAHADLVRGVKQEEIATEYNITKGRFPPVRRHRAESRRQTGLQPIPGGLRSCQPGSPGPSEGRRAPAE